MPEVVDAPASLSGRLRSRLLHTRYRIRLQTRFLLYATSLIVAIMTLLVVIVERRMGDLIARQARKRGLAIARNLAAVSQPSLVTYNYVALAQNAERAKRDEEGIADVIILDKEGRVAAYSQHGERQGSVLTDPLSLRSAAATGELVQPVELPREDGRSERGLDISVPVFIENSREKWGTVRLRLSTEEMHRQIRDTRLTLLGIGLGAVGLGVLGSFFMARRITGPLGRLVHGTIRAAGGDLRTRIEIATGDEIEELARNFNEMIGQIRANQAAVEELNRRLEEKVQIRTGDLERANRELTRAYAERQKAEAQMVHSEKMASLGQVVAGIAHEINTPSSAIGAAVFNINGYLESLAPRMRELVERGLPEPLAERFYPVVRQALSPDAARGRLSTSEVRERSRRLEASLAARGFGEPRGLALTAARLGLDREVAELAEAGGGATPQAAFALFESLGSLAIAVNDIRLSIDAVTRMVRALKGYSHPDQAERTDADIHDGIETTLTILRNQIRSGVVVERRYARLPPVTCNVGELNQVWTNLIHNAIQAMHGVGHITIETYARDGCAAVRITDSGPGIPEEIRDRIFDPFFTTKDQGEGTGLGLGICQQIVERHGGRIGVRSEPGRTSFEVLLPLGGGTA